MTVEAEMADAAQRAEREAAARRRKSNNGAHAPGSAGGSVIHATPFVWRDPSLIPPRRFLYDRHYVRKFITTTIAPGGVGKTSLTVAEAVAMVTGRNLLGYEVARPLRVWLWNGEDPLEEMERKVAAALQHFNTDPAELGDRLFLNSGRDMQIHVARAERGEVIVAEPVVDQLVATFLKNKIDVGIFDPFVETHSVVENDNGGINRAARQWAYIADVCDASIELIHHTRKPPSNGAGEITVDDSRGAVALVSAARSARVINRMTKDEGSQAGVENFRLYFRVDNGKANLMPPADVAKWRKLVGVDLANGDSVGVVEKFDFPDPFSSITPTQARQVQDAVAKDEWRADIRSPRWVGKAVAAVLDLDLDDDAHKAKAKALLKTWLKNGALKEVTKSDRRRHPVTMIEVGQWIVP